LARVFNAGSSYMFMRQEESETERLRETKIEVVICSSLHSPYGVGKQHGRPEADFNALVTCENNDNRHGGTIG
jgi:hypothetical protein